MKYHIRNGYKSVLMAFGFKHLSISTMCCFWHLQTDRKPANWFFSSLCPTANLWWRVHHQWCSTSASQASINPTCALWPFLLRETEVQKQCFCEIGESPELGNFTSQHVDVLFDLCVNTFPLESARPCVRVSVSPWQMVHYQKCLHPEEMERWTMNDIQAWLCVRKASTRQNL